MTLRRLRHLRCGVVARDRARLAPRGTRPGAVGVPAPLDDDPHVVERPWRARLRRDGVQDHRVPRAPLPGRELDDDVAQLRLRQLPRHPRRRRGHRGHVVHRHHAERDRVPAGDGDHPHAAVLPGAHARRVRLRADGPRRERERHDGEGDPDGDRRAGRCLLALQLQRRHRQSRPARRTRARRTIRPTTRTTSGARASASRWPSGA